MSEEGARILLVTRNFPPLRGGMERLNQRLLQGLAVHHPVFLVGPDGCGAHARAASGVQTVPAAPLWRFLPACLLAALRSASRHGPDIVLAGSGLTAPIAWLAARRAGGRSAVYLHGLDIIAPSAVYQALWLPMIRRCDRVIVNSRNTRDLAVARGVPAERVCVVHPGTDLPMADPSARRRFREIHRLGEAPVLLSVGRLTARKGLVEFVREVFPLVLQRHPDTRLVVVGDDPVDALHGGGAGGRRALEASAEQVGVRHALLCLGTCSDGELSDAYSGADVHVFPVRSTPGDVEGFGMVAIEAAAHGVPTVAYAVGGVSDAVADGQSGTLVAPNDGHAFAAAVLEWLAHGSQAAAGCRRFASGFSWARFDSELREALAITASARQRA
ncbi:glycosyltransferase family 4 protein [Vulcaniibacterium gelatinicum]|uniref:glycosyltransferase family 4 protein n=1 Tax=Vulcaniibacterium gelatinicum TaxID=2598725 RepID=UPI0011CA3755|nr:glycosyltransferase family 4 protein [Vulcaniibacterium gelatinicum]